MSRDSEHTILMSSTAQNQSEENRDNDLYREYIDEVNRNQLREQEAVQNGIQLRFIAYSVQHQQQQQQQAQYGRNLRERGEDWPPFVQRRPYLRTFLRNLLVLDHFLVALIFPFSLYTIFKALFSEVTFSEYDFLTEVFEYCQFVKIIDKEGDSLLLYKDGLGLLGKFSNIVVYYTAPAFHYLIQRFGSNKIIHWAYPKTVKLITVSVYMSYGLATSVYLSFALFFFMLCVFITCARRYKGVERILTQVYQTTGGVF